MNGLFCDWAAGSWKCIPTSNAQALIRRNIAVSKKWPVHKGQGDIHHCIIHPNKRSLIQCRSSNQDDNILDSMSTAPHPHHHDLCPDFCLEFGTAGLRAKMQPGPHGINTTTIQQTAQGICTYLLKSSPNLLLSSEEDGGGGICIGYDGRHNSKTFANIISAVFLSQGITVHLFSKTVPTPAVSFAVTHLGTAAGLVVTASHNPKEYSGLKVFASNGCQIISPTDELISNEIRRKLDLWDIASTYGSLKGEGVDGVGGNLSLSKDGVPNLKDPLSKIQQAYTSSLKSLVQYRSNEINSKSPPLVYTALHGVGTPWMDMAFSAVGLPPLIKVVEQCSEDPEFPTVLFPNPEEGEGVWALTLSTAEKVGARVAIANDPDADRLAVAEHVIDVDNKGGGRWVFFTGNEIGAMLACWVLKNEKEKMNTMMKNKGESQQQEKQQLAVLSSTVSSHFLSKIAKVEGASWTETLTGFKWLGNEAIAREKEGQVPIFAFEEALGFALCKLSKDKDGISAAVAIAELTGHLYNKNDSSGDSGPTTLCAYLASLKAKYGYTAYRSCYFIANPPQRSIGLFNRLRRTLPSKINGLEVSGVRDLGTGLDSNESDGRAKLPWKSGDLMITYTLEGGLARVTIRASGTEPKLKVYLEVENSPSKKGEGEKEVERRADVLLESVIKELVVPEEAGLVYPSS